MTHTVQLLSVFIPVCMYVCIRVKSFYAFSYAVCTKIHCTKTGDDCTQERMYGTDLNIFRVPVTLR